MAARSIEHKQPKELISQNTWGNLGGGALCGAVACAGLIATAERYGMDKIPASWASPLQNMGLCVLAASGLGIACEQLTRFDSSKETPLFLLVSRAVIYGFGLWLGLVLLILGHQPERWTSLVSTPVDQAVVGVGAVLIIGLTFICGVCPVRGGTFRGPLKPFREQVESLRNSYTFTLGKSYSEDWEEAKKGKPQWCELPESGLFGNLLVLGQIGSGKTTQFADPVVLQAVQKFPEDVQRRMSVVVLGVKGNETSRYFSWAKELGREKECCVIRPDIVQNEKGEPLIPKERYRSMNLLGGWTETDLLAIELQEALESTKEQKSPDYFRIVQQEFLTHAFRLLTAKNGRLPDLAELQRFGASEEVRAEIIRSQQTQTEPTIVDSVTYFTEEFGELDRKDQAGLLRGLASQLTLLTNRAVLNAFCPGRGDDPRPEFKGWAEEVMNKPSVVLFSCPPAKYTAGLSRLLGLVFLKSFQQAMLERVDASFTGNKTRPVMLVIDEAHAFMNKGIGDFMALSRESRAISLLLTQAISQIPFEYRGVVADNCRTKVALSVAGDTAKVMSDFFGEFSEVIEQFSTSESLHGATQHMLLDKKVGRSQGVAASRSYTERRRPRFAKEALQELEPFRAVVQLFDGAQTLPAQKIHTAPWYRLPYYLLEVRRHRNVQCNKGGAHQYNPTRLEGVRGLRCQKCGHTISGWELKDYETFLQSLKTSRAQ